MTYKELEEIIDSLPEEELTEEERIGIMKGHQEYLRGEYVTLDEIRAERGMERPCDEKTQKVSRHPHTRT